jgi:extracellular elastinolytic metalloproteinase
LKGVADNFGLDITLTDAAVTGSLKGETDEHVIQGAVGTHQDPKARLMYIQTGDTVKLVWRVETDLFNQWFLSYVDASEASTIHGTINWGADADYQV